MLELKNISKQTKHDWILNHACASFSDGISVIHCSSPKESAVFCSIVSGQEVSFQGSICLDGLEFTSLSNETQRSQYHQRVSFLRYHPILLDHLSAREQLLLLQSFYPAIQPADIDRVLKQLQLFSVSEQKVKSLSHEQRLQLALAQELLKRPRVLLIDPQLAASSWFQSSFSVLRNISNTTMILVVTQDDSVQFPSDHQFSLTQGRFSTDIETHTQNTCFSMPEEYKLSVSSACTLVRSQIRSNFKLSVWSLICLTLSAIVFIAFLGSKIANDPSQKMTQSINQHGTYVLDLHLGNNITDLTSVSTPSDDSSERFEIKQDIAYADQWLLQDPRVQQLVYTQTFHDVSLSSNRVTHSITETNAFPVINRVLAGRLPQNNAAEVAITEQTASLLGDSFDEVLGQTIVFDAKLYDWEQSDYAIEKSVHTEAVVTGIIDATITYPIENTVNEICVSDSFFFSRSLILQMHQQAELSEDIIDFKIRAKNANDYLSLCRTLTQKGIQYVPNIYLQGTLGAQIQSYLVISSPWLQGPSFLLAAGLIVLGAYLFVRKNKKTFAVYRQYGCKIHHMISLSLLEFCFQTLLSVLILILLNPLVKFLLLELFPATIQSYPKLYIGFLAPGLFCFLLATVWLTVLCHFVFSHRKNKNL